MAKNFVEELQEKCSFHIGKLSIRSTFQRGQQLFRGTARHMEGEWRDWAYVDWGDDGVLPAKFWGFVDLTQLPEENNVCHGGQGPGILPQKYAIVESARKVSRKNARITSELFTEYRLELVAGPNNTIKERIFWLADVEAIGEPVAVLPDCGGKMNGYLVLERRCNWAKLFDSWLMRPYEDFPEFPPSSEEENGQYEEESTSGEE